VSTLPFAKYFITMDYTFIDKKLKIEEMLNIKSTKIFIANLCPDYMIEERGLIVDTRNNYVYCLNDFDVIIKSRVGWGLGAALNNFAHGDNSGFCAFQLAVCLGYKNIHLLGIDLNAKKKTHYHNGYNQNIVQFNKKLTAYADAFQHAFIILKIKHRNINIYNYSPKSVINEMVCPKKLEDINE